MARRGPGRLHGYLVIDKPAGWTSHDVVARVRKLTGERKVGHAGTLDPAATGVLPVAVGLATRSLEFLAESSKTYVAEITFGITTDSHDIDGSVVATAPTTDLDRTRVEQALESFKGHQMQVPPMYSAVRIDGHRLYELARRGEEVAREPRPIVIHEIELKDWQPPVATVCIDCSKGTYIRTLAHDLGVRLGCGAFLSNLVRVRTGPFTLGDAWTLAELSEIDLAIEWTTVAVHPDAALESMPGIVIDERESLDWINGKPLAASSPATAEWVRVYDNRGRWLGVGRRADEAWQPHKVINEAA